MTDKEKREVKDGVISIFKRFNILDHTATIGGLRNDILEYVDSLPNEPISEDLNEAATAYNKKVNFVVAGNVPNEHFIAGAQWQKEHLWKDAQGDDLPEIDREVVVLVKYSTQRNIHDKEYSTYRVEFGHRPNPNGWDGKSIATGKVEHYTPKTYDKGGWNIPDIVYWLDVELPKEIEL